jgi:hypothetical protein
MKKRNAANIRKYNAAVISGGEEAVEYDLFVSVDYSEDQGMDALYEFLETKLGNKRVFELCYGSGTCLMTGLRDYHFRGNKKDIDDITAVLAKQGSFLLHHYGIQTVEPD